MVNETTDIFFAKYKDHSTIWPFIPAVCVLIPVILIGTVGNLSVFVVTIRTKTLRNSCNYLLAMACISDVAHASSLYLTLYVIISRTNFIPLQVCFYSQFLPLVGLNVGLALTMLIGIDRLISVLFPLRHRSFNTPIYLSILLFLSVLYALKIISKGYFYMIEHPDELVACTIVDALPGDTGGDWFMSCAVINLITVTCYSAVGIALKIKVDVNEQTKRIFKSLTVIMLFLVFGWLFNAIMRTIFILVDADELTINYAGIYGGTLVNITIASNAYILYVFSHDYREALKQELNFFSKKLIGKQFVPTTTYEHSNQRPVNSITIQ